MEKSENWMGFWENLSKSNDLPLTLLLYFPEIFSYSLSIFLTFKSPTNIKLRKILLCFIFNQVTVYRLV